MDKEIFFNCKLEGCAAEIVVAKMEEKKQESISRYGKPCKYGKQTATQALLCELWQLRKENGL